jgi:transcriptional regulator with XRE-family HTH domain
MRSNKRNKLKETVKLKLLAEQAGIKQSTLSRILHNRQKTSLELATKLAALANIMTLSNTYEPKDFM